MIATPITGRGMIRKKAETGGKTARKTRIIPAMIPILLLVAPVSSESPMFPDDVL